jgi:hypothetical protein
MSPHDRSLQQIKRETEQSRADPTETVERLRASISDTAFNFGASNAVESNGYVLFAERGPRRDPDVD